MSYEVTYTDTDGVDRVATLGNGALVAYCPSCTRNVRVSEPYAFGGRDRTRSTLACGHVVARCHSV